jgi:hypothetical protein
VGAVNGNPGPDPDEAHLLTGEQLEEAAPRSVVRKTEPGDVQTTYQAEGLPKRQGARRRWVRQSAVAARPFHSSRYCLPPTERQSASTPTTCLLVSNLSSLRAGAGQTAARRRLQKPTPPGVSRTSAGQQAPDGSPSEIRDRLPMVGSGSSELAQAAFPRRSQSPKLSSVVPLSRAGARRSHSSRAIVTTGTELAIATATLRWPDPARLPWRRTIAPGRGEHTASARRLGRDCFAGKAIAPAVRRRRRWPRPVADEVPYRDRADRALEFRSGANATSLSHRLADALVDLGQVDSLISTDGSAGGRAPLGALVSPTRRPQQRCSAGAVQGSSGGLSR